ncbi:MAG: competence/damage-inducible protein A [Planctomycetota bacterium]
MHRSAIIVAIGDELILGQALDTNSRRLAAWLVDRGIMPRRHLTLDDDEIAIELAIREAARETDLVILTGGLGPTADDLTRHALARTLDEKLITDDAALEHVRGWFARTGRAMPEANAVQAKRPPSAAMIPNPHGTAPGLHATLSDADIFCLPGPPREMRPMFEDHVLPKLRPAGVVRTRILRTVGLGESTVAGMLGDLMDRGRNPLVGTTASSGVVSCRLRYEGDDADLAEQLLDETEASVRDTLGPLVFGSGDDTLPGAIVRALTQHSATVTTVESCTGGMIVSALTDVRGSSAVLERCFVTYSNEAKADLVGVDPGVFQRDGAVSRACVVQMAEGGLARAGAQYAVAVSGIAGPDGGTDAKPVGTVWIAVASNNGPTDARRFHFNGDREAVRAWSVTLSLAMLWFAIAGDPQPVLLGQADPAG